ncbi:hypothetical protein ANAEL_01474 [Anaerolineales bacterium]|nr:hypothetical protein ANAEL_01474 [Anaerolineales bacterium]
MKRVHLFEFTDLPWYPQTFRSIQTDYLQFASTLGSGHKNLVPLFKKAMQHAETTEILDLCSGGTGPWIRLQEEFKQVGMDVKIKLTDKFPNPESVQRWGESSRQGIEYLSESIDAMKVPSHLKGMRTMFEGFHHFKPEQASLILRDAVENRTAIGIFEASLKPPLGFLILLLSPLMTLLSYLLVTPFITPRTFARFFWTYLIPIVPLATCWDGVISLLKVYSMRELKELTRPLQNQNYTWEIGQASTGTPIFAFTYLLGYPVK